jgi:pSer/pThr/pTyr-binding forkhead associated (FHA) protein
MSDSFLKILSGPREGLNIPLKNSSIVIGRKKGDIIINDPLLSGSHAKFYPTTEGWYVEDLQSTNGTSVNGKITQRAKLSPGIEISFGNTTIVMFVGQNVISETKTPPTQHLNIAWLLDEEKDDITQTSREDLINNDLRVPPNLKAEIEVVAGQDTGRTFPLSSGSITIGRRHGEIPLTDVEVSRKHTIIELFSRDMIFLRDMQSTNGTFHNGRRVATAKLQNGDTIGIGRSVLRIRVRN